MKNAPVWLGLFVMAACTCQDRPASPDPAPAGSRPKIYFSAQPWLRGGPVGESDAAPTAPAGDAGQPEAVGTEAGERLHAEVSKTCSDKPCSGPKCERLCGQWVAELGPSVGGAARKNALYFNCVGGCLAGPKPK